MIEILQYPFMLRALIACLLIGGLASYLSCFIVQRRMSFLGSGLAHSCLGGVALALWLDVEPLLLVSLFSVFVSLAISWTTQNTQLEQDTSIGIFFSMATAMGIIFLSLRTQYTGDATTYLFGSILSVQNSDLYFAGGFCLLLILLFPMWSRWAYAGFDRDLAQADRICVKRDDYMLHFVLALAVVLCLKVLGIILLAAFLVIPGASARMISKTFTSMTLKSIVIGILSSVGGLYLSYIYDLPSGATIILVQSAIFIVIALTMRLRRSN